MICGQGVVVVKYQKVFIGDADRCGAPQQEFQSDTDYYTKCHLSM